MQGMQERDGVTTDFLTDATKHGTKLYHAIDAVLKGKELPLPDGVEFRDKDGHPRTHVRVRWFDSPAGKTFRDYALASGEEFPDVAVPAAAVESAVPYTASEPPVFFGHYWLRAETPTKLSPNVACVDYSVAKGGCLCAYRWDGLTARQSARRRRWGTSFIQRPQSSQSPRTCPKSQSSNGRDRA